MTAPTPAPAKKKSLFKRPLFWVLVIVVLVIVIIASSAGGSDKPGPASTSTGAPQSSAASAGAVGATSAPAAKPTDDPFADGGWTASDIQVEKSQFGTSVSARVTNTGDVTKTGVFTITIFSNGQRIADVQGSASDVEPGTASTVKFIGTTQTLPGDPSTYTYEFESDF
jgi:hypothetical protein